MFAVFRFPIFRRCYLSVVIFPCCPCFPLFDVHGFRFPCFPSSRLFPIVCADSIYLLDIGNFAICESPEERHVLQCALQCRDLGHGLTQLPQRIHVQLHLAQFLEPLRCGVRAFHDFVDVLLGGNHVLLADRGVAVASFAVLSRNMTKHRPCHCCKEVNTHIKEAPTDKNPKNI